MSVSDGRSRWTCWQVIAVMDDWKVPVTLIRTTSGGVDEYGDPLPGSPERVELPPALFAPGRTSEPVNPGEKPVISLPSLYWRGEHPRVTARDLIEVMGGQYRVEGAPQWWPSGMVVSLKGVDDGS